MKHFITQYFVRLVKRSGDWVRCCAFQALRDKLKMGPVARLGVRPMLGTHAESPGPH